MFAQESVMDVQKQDDLIKEAFEIEAEEIGFCLDQLWGDYENPYENSDTALAFNLFKKGWLAKAQAVPEGFILVPKELSDEKADIQASLAWGCHLGFFKSQNRDMSTTEIEEFRLKWCRNKARDLQEEYKAMIEAQEQSHV